jgi:hypothetical protein
MNPLHIITEFFHQYSSSRRLPLRLFSSTRRLFGTSPATPVHSSTPSLPARSSTYTAPQSSVSGFAIPPPSQQRRLAEFATILGDFKLAVAVWESLRKEGKGGSVGIISYNIFLLSNEFAIRMSSLCSLLPRQLCSSTSPML